MDYDGEILPFYHFAIYNFINHFFPEVLADSNLYIFNIEGITFYAFYFVFIDDKGFVYFDKDIGRQLLFQAPDGNVYHHFFGLCM